MPSRSLSIHLVDLLQDAEDLESAHVKLRTGTVGRQFGLAAINRAAVVVAVSAWESIVEELMRESMEALRPAAPPLDPWPAPNAHVLGQLGRFHTPNATNVASLIRNCLSLPDVTTSWTWRNCTPTQASARLNDLLQKRHEIAHGVSPRPAISNAYSGALPAFIERLAECTDRAVRAHLATVLGVVHPWP